MANWPVNAQQMMEAQRPNNVIEDALSPVFQEIEKLRQQTQLLDERVKLLEHDMGTIEYEVQEVQRNNLQHMNNNQWVQHAHQELARIAAALQDRAPDVQSKSTAASFPSTESHPLLET